MKSTPGDSSCAHDGHQWGGDLPKQPCGVTVGLTCGKRHGRTCIRCGVSREGPFPQPGNSHQFLYRHPNGVRSPLPPPCLDSSSSDIVVDDLMVCDKCGEPPRGPGLPCPHGHNETFRQIKSCRDTRPLGGSGD